MSLIGINLSEIARTITAIKFLPIYIDIQLVLSELTSWKNNKFGERLIGYHGFPLGEIDVLNLKWSNCRKDPFKVLLGIKHLIVALRVSSRSLWIC